MLRKSHIKMFFFEEGKLKGVHRLSQKLKNPFTISMQIVKNFLELIILFLITRIEGIFSRKITVTWTYLGIAEYRMMNDLKRVAKVKNVLSPMKTSTEFPHYCKNLAFISLLA